MPPWPHDRRTTFKTQDVPIDYTVSRRCCVGPPFLRMTDSPLRGTARHTPRADRDTEISCPSEWRRRAGIKPASPRRRRGRGVAAISDPVRSPPETSLSTPLMTERSPPSSTCVLVPSVLVLAVAVKSCSDAGHTWGHGRLHRHLVSWLQGLVPKMHGCGMARAAQYISSPDALQSSTTALWPSRRCGWPSPRDGRRRQSPM